MSETTTTAATATTAPAIATMADLLSARAAERPDDQAYVFLDDDLEPRQSLTFAQLEQRARAVAAALQRGGEAGDRVLLVFPAGIEFVVAFWGCLIAGRVAVTAYPPHRARLRQSLRRLQAIVADAGASVLLTESSLARDIEACRDQVPDIDRLDHRLTDELDASPGRYREPALAPEDLAFLQYTSGSTSRPKGVMVTHANLLANLEAIRTAFELTRESISCCWLPSAHDMGLVDGILHGVYGVSRTYLLSPLTFLKRPSAWLEAISRHRGDHGGGPNFAYDLCAARVPEATRSLLDLSCWRRAYNGAEPVRADTLERFSRAFAGCGFRHRAHYPCYGLAEATLMVTGVAVGDEPRIVEADADALAGGGVRSADPEARRRRLVSCGRAVEGLEVAVVDPDAEASREPGRVGEIWVRGGSVAAGYWQRPEETRRTFGARLDGTSGGDGGGTFLRTGDLGALIDGELVVTGRIKDLIIVDGRNLYPQDLEFTAERCHPAVRPGCTAAFAVEVDGTERVAVAVEVRIGAGATLAASDADEMVRAIRRAVAEEHEVGVERVALLPPHSLPKTSSGKLRRFAVRRGLDDGEITPLAMEGR